MLRALPRAHKLHLAVGLYSPSMDGAHPFDELVALCARLRAPGGCPWDREQDLTTLPGYLIEEAYEVVEAMASEDPHALRGELGDLLFHVLFIADLARERGWFDIAEVCRTVHAKMVRRHPHVFGTVEVSGAGEVVQNWERIKRQEPGDAGALDSVPKHLPALLKAVRISEKAAAVGFDWQRANDVGAKLQEEVGELLAALQAGGERQQAGVREELGDVLFVMANLARKLGVDPEAALQAANEKFKRRFVAMERLAAERQVRLADLPLAELDALWDEVKRGEGQGES